MLGDLMQHPRHTRFGAFVLMAILFLAVIDLGLLVPVYAGLLVHALVMRLSRRIVKDGDLTTHSRWIAVAVVAAVVVAVLMSAGAGLHLLLRNSTDVQALLLKMGDILDSARSWLPAGLGAILPQQDDLLSQAGIWLRAHAAEIGTFGLGTLQVIGYALLGILLGAMVAISDAAGSRPLGPVSARLLEQILALREAFWGVASAQIRISLLNTIFTALYLVVVLPAFGVHLPFTKTLIVVTFIAGLLPVVGNLISNTAITIISLSVSMLVAAGSLAFLVVIHKLEYFINARIVGIRIDARAWEILLWMLLMERLFGPAGVVAAPVFYAWLKAEWHRWDRGSAPPVSP
jgi:predicted PurR-regulated permease PerM